MAASFSASLLLLPLLLFASGWRSEGATFTLVNKCSYGVWPGISADAGHELLGQGGMALSPGQSTSVEAPAGWSGRFWARTGCRFDSTGHGICDTGDCGGVIQCNGAGGSPPVTLAEFTLDGSDAKDFYDVSLVDGYNLPITVSTAQGAGLSSAGGSSSSSTTTAPCATAGCSTGSSPSLLGVCPPALMQTDAAGRVVACRSACDAFKMPQFCCTGAYSTPQTCAPSSYSQLFKSVCPSAYSYAYDDPSSTFTCPSSAAAAYTITFCPS